MAEFLLTAAGFVLATVAIGLVRILRGPSEADRIMAAQLLGTGGIATLLLLVSSLTVWTKRQLLDTNQWTASASRDFVTDRRHRAFLLPTSVVVQGFGRRPIEDSRRRSGAVVRKPSGKEPAGVVAYRALWGFRRSAGRRDRC